MHPLITPELIDALAGQIHEIWIRWMKKIFSRCIVSVDGTVSAPTEYVMRWMRQMTTQYGDLSEVEKEIVRKEACSLAGVMVDTIALQEAFYE